MPGDSAVSCLSLNGLTIGTNENRGHQAEGTVALSDDIRLDISVVVFAGPDETARALKTLSDHVVNKAVLVPDAQFLEFRFVAPVLKM